MITPEQRQAIVWHADDIEHSCAWTCSGPPDPADPCWHKSIAAAMRAMLQENAELRNLLADATPEHEPWCDRSCDCGATPQREPMPDCCDTPAYCSAARRCTRRAI